MKLKALSDPQRQSLLDLAVLAMYADGHLAAVEDARVRRLLEAMGYESDYDRTRHFDAAVTRVRQHAHSAEAARSHAITLAQSFSTREQRRQADEILNDLMTSDNEVAATESCYLAAVREALRI